MIRKRLVRIHMYKDAPSIEGILVSRRAGFYHLLKPALLAAEGQTHDMEGEVWVPKENVLMVQVLS